MLPKQKSNLQTLYLFLKHGDYNVFKQRYSYFVYSITFIFLQLPFWHTVMHNDIMTLNTD